MQLRQRCLDRGPLGFALSKITRKSFVIGKGHVAHSPQPDFHPLGWAAGPWSLRAGSCPPPLRTGWEEGSPPVVQAHPGIEKPGTFVIEHAPPSFVTFVVCA